MATSEIRPEPPAVSAEVRLALVQHELDNERRDEVMDARKRARIHIMWLSVGGVLSVVLLLLHLDIASVSATGVAPLLAEGTVLLRRL
jgi:pimeloyl-ACP methyl ester carboxylesterase